MKSLSLGFLACAASLFWLAGCASPRPAPEVPSVQAFSRNPFSGIEFPRSRLHNHDVAVRLLGRPRETLTREAPSEQDPSVIDTVITLRYPFGDLVYLHVPGKDLENLILIRLHGNPAPLKYGIRFGRTTREGILRLFGPPQHTEDNSVSYDIVYTPEITNSTTFFFKDGVLLQVDISSLMMD